MSQNIEALVNEWTEKLLSEFPPTMGEAELSREFKERKEEVAREAKDFVGRLVSAASSGLTVRELVRLAHEGSKANGWYEREDAILSVLRKVSNDPSYSKDDRGAAKQALVDGVSKLPERFMLMVTEISEAMEEHRAGRSPTEVYYKCANKECHSPGFKDTPGACAYCGSPMKPEGVPVELADVVIRVADAAGRYNIDLEAAIRLKIEHNATRGLRHGGKVC